MQSFFNVRFISLHYAITFFQKDICICKKCIIVSYIATDLQNLLQFLQIKIYAAIAINNGLNAGLISLINHVTELL